MSNSRVNVLYTDLRMIIIYDRRDFTKFIAENLQQMWSKYVFVISQTFQKFYRDANRDQTIINKERLGLVK